MKRVFALTIVAAAAAFAATAASAQTLNTIKSRGVLHLGANGTLAGFGLPDAQGAWTGLDVDFCRALAAAIFNDPTKIKFVPLTAKDRFTALQSGDVDVLARNTTWTSSRDTQLGLNFTGVNYYDGQGFMTPRARNRTSALELDGSKVCVQSGTTTELNLADYFRANNMKFEAAIFPALEPMLKAYESGQCDVLTADVSQLYALRLKIGKAAEHDILPDVISKEPLSPVVRQKDDDWHLLVKWTLFAMINAEELGIDSKNIDAAMKSKKPEVMRFVGTEGDYGEWLGLSKDWAARIIRHVGNYGEVYERNVGTNSPLGIPRGLNQIWSAGGILYAPPIR